MNARIPVLYDRVLRPEWIDFALEQYLKAEDEKALTQTLREYLSIEVRTATSLRKTVRQLQRAVGFLSPIPHNRLLAAYGEMSKLAPDQRSNVRFRLLVESTPFIADVVNSIRKLTDLGIDGIQVSQLYERNIEKYGERGTIPRRVRYVLQTLANFKLVTNREQKWYVVDRKAFSVIQQSQR